MIVTLAPLSFEELPSHPSFPTSTTRPALLDFALALLDQGRAFVLPQSFSLNFKHHSDKSSPPSNNEVEILSATIPASRIAQRKWNTPEIPRSAPAKVEDEHWYARRSVHHNSSSKHNHPGTASWEEFVYGLRDQHSKHEFDFTPTIYDARLVCEWNEALNEALGQMGEVRYSHATMSVYEMCHKMPGILDPRCFPVLVVTASVSETEFVAVTITVDIAKFEGAFYSNGRNRKEGKGDMGKAVTMGQYCAVERVQRYPVGARHADKEGGTHEHEGKGEEIEWVMATASDAKGNLPMAMQRMGIPGAVAKDVGLFFKWIRNVPDEEISKQEVGTNSSK